MDLSLDSTALVALLLAAVRAAGFVALAPPFASRSIPAQAKAGFALALAVLVLPTVRTEVSPPTAGYLVTTAVTEVAIGAALGFMVALLFQAVQTAGQLIDVAGGFSLQPAFDPGSMTMNSSVGRLHQLLAVTLLFTSGGHLVMVRGFVRSYSGLAVGAALPTDRLAPVLLHGISAMFLAALQIAGPMIAVLFLADVAVALLSKAAPGLNVFSVGIPMKIMLVVSLLALTIPLLPAALDGLLDDGVRSVLWFSR